MASSCMANIITGKVQLQHMYPLFIMHFLKAEMEFTRSSINHGVKGSRPSNLFLRSRTRRTRTLTEEWKAFSSNHLAWRMAVRCPCIIFPSTAQKKQDNGKSQIHTSQQQKPVFSAKQHFEGTPFKDLHLSMTRPETGNAGDQLHITATNFHP